MVDSGHPDFKADDLVSGLLNWGEYSVVKGGHLLQKLDTSPGFPLSYYAGGVLGNIYIYKSSIVNLQWKIIDVRTQRAQVAKTRKNKS